MRIRIKDMDREAVHLLAQNCIDLKESKSKEQLMQSELKAMVEEPFYEGKLGTFRIAYHGLKMQLLP